jgi:hypothetical protein
LLLAGCQDSRVAVTPQPKRVDIPAVAMRYLSMRQAFDQRGNEIQRQLRTANTLDQVRAVYAAAAAAVHNLDAELLGLPLFPTALKDDWKSLMLANRRLEDVYGQLSLAIRANDQQSLARLLVSAKLAQSVAEDRFRHDLLLPQSGALTEP